MPGGYGLDFMPTIVCGDGESGVRPATCAVVVSYVCKVVGHMSVIIHWEDRLRESDGLTERDGGLFSVRACVPARGFRGVERAT